MTVSTPPVVYSEIQNEEIDVGMEQKEGKALTTLYRRHITALVTVA